MPDIPIEILKYGPLGLGLALAILSASLLWWEQRRNEAREQMLRAIYIFMTFSIVLVVVGFTAQRWATPTLPSVESARFASLAASARRAPLRGRIAECQDFLHQASDLLKEAGNWRWKEFEDDASSSDSNLLAISVNAAADTLDCEARR